MEAALIVPFDNQGVLPLRHDGHRPLSFRSPHRARQGPERHRVGRVHARPHRKRRHVSHNLRILRGLRQRRRFRLLLLGRILTAEADTRGHGGATDPSPTESKQYFNILLN